MTGNYEFCYYGLRTSQLSPCIFAYSKQSKAGGREDLGEAFYGNPMYEVFCCTCVKYQLMFKVSLAHLVVRGYHSIATETLIECDCNSYVFMNVCTSLQPQRQ